MAPYCQDMLWPTTVALPPACPLSHRVSPSRVSKGSTHHPSGSWPIQAAKANGRANQHWASSPGITPLPDQTAFLEPSLQHHQWLQSSTGKLSDSHCHCWAVRNTWIRLGGSAPSPLLPENAGPSTNRPGAGHAEPKQSSHCTTAHDKMEHLGRGEGCVTHWGQVKSG